MKQGARTIAGLGRTFKRCDNNGDKKIDLDEFTQLVREINLTFKLVTFVDSSVSSIPMAMAQSTMKNLFVQCVVR